MDTPPSRRQKRHEQVREEILDATRKVLLDKGWAGLTLAAIAKQLELTKAALYYYFPSKEALAFELIYLALKAHLEAVEAVASHATNGAEAVEAMIRTTDTHFQGRMDEFRLIYMVTQVGKADAERAQPEMVARIRPFNDRLYGGPAALIRKDQEAGRANPNLDPRRHVFLAHMAIIGLLTMEGMIASMDRAPLIHPHAAMVDDLVQSFTARLALRPK